MEPVGERVILGGYKTGTGLYWEDVRVELVRLGYTGRHWTWGETGLYWEVVRVELVRLGYTGWMCGWNWGQTGLYWENLRVELWRDWAMLGESAV